MPKPFSPKPVMISTSEAAAMFSVASGTLQNLRSKKRGCRYYKVGRAVRYKISDLEEFFSQNPVLTIDSFPEVR